MKRNLRELHLIKSKILKVIYRNLIKIEMKKLFICSVFILISSAIFSQKFTQWDGNQLTLYNNLVKRVITITSSGGFSTSSLMVSQNAYNFVNNGCDEFSFLLNDKYFDGSKNWKFFSYETNDSASATIRLRGTTKETESLELSITYMLYPDLPIIRKKIVFKNVGINDMKIEGLIVERLNTPYNLTKIWTYNNFARQKWYGQLFEGNHNDPLVVVHNISDNNGIVLGNETPGLLKETTVLQKDGLLTVGLTQPDKNFSFQKWIEPGEEWDSPWVFIVPYINEKEPFDVLNITVSDYVRNHIGLRLGKIPKKPGFVYNTWFPFKSNINDTLIINLAEVAAECGIEEFVIDDGWQTNRGDWEVDKEKFPNGLKPVFDYIKSKGMKPGLWISISAVEENSEIYTNNPEWAIRSKEGIPDYIHNDTGKTPAGGKSFSMSLGTGWYEYIKNKILYLVKEHGLEYLKADLAVVSGAYTYEKFKSGDYSSDNKFYKTREESLLVLYRRIWQLFDDLHTEAPELFIDCTFETMGALHLIDFDMCKYAEGNWLSNIEDSFPVGAFRVRQIAWARTPVIPATALVIGNLPLNGSEWESNLKSLVGTIPILLGDLRKINPETRGKIREWTNWLKEMQRKYDYLMFRQDLPGYGEPTEGSWDGWSRINTETKGGGIVGIFKENAIEAKRLVSIPYLETNSYYEIRKAPSGELIETLTGEELKTKRI